MLLDARAKLRARQTQQSRGFCLVVTGTYQLPGDVIDLEGHDLVIVPLGFNDTDNTTCLHVPSIGLIVAGDAAYKGVHLRLVEFNQQGKRQEWLAALDKMESLKLWP